MLYNRSYCIAIKTRLNLMKCKSKISIFVWIWTDFQKYCLKYGPTYKFSIKKNLVIVSFISKWLHQRVKVNIWAKSILQGLIWNTVLFHKDELISEYIAWNMAFMQFFNQKMMTLWVLCQSSFIRGWKWPYGLKVYY